METTATATPTLPPAATSPAASDLWLAARDPAARVATRLGAVGALLESDPAEAAAFVVAELSRDDLTEGWCDALVFLAEDIHLPAALRQQVGDRLLAIAASLRDSARAGVEKVVGSARRRAASLLPQDQAERLLPFLECPSTVDTRSVALRCLERVFESAPPPDGDPLTALRDRAAQFAFQFLDPDVFAGGENALIAQNALCALAALGDDRLGEAIARVKQLGRPWMNRQVRTRLEQLRESWRARDPKNSGHPAFQNLEDHLRSLG